MNSASIDTTIEALAKIRQNGESLPSMIGELSEVLARIPQLIEGSRDRASLERLREELLKNQHILANAEILLRQWRDEFSFETYDPSARMRRGLT
jgi:hypothetical protein